MLNFIKNLLKKEVLETIRKEELHEWFKDKAVDKEKEFKEALKDLKKSITSKVKECHGSLEQLENAVLRNDNIPTREKQFMEGNRKSYVQRTQQLLREIDEIIDHEISFFLHHYKDYLNNFTKSTSRSFGILTNFFAQEVRAIAGKLREIDILVNRLTSDPKMQNASRLQKVNKDLLLLTKKLERKQSLVQDIKDAKDAQKKIHDDLKAKQDQLKELKEGNEFKELNNLIQKKQSAQKDVQEHKNKLYQAFSPLDRALRKYQRVALEHSSLVEQYASDVFSALSSDHQLHIVSILEKLKQGVDKGSIEVKQPQKVVEAVDVLTKQYLTDFLKKLSQLKEADEKLQSQIDDTQIGREIERAEQKVSSLKELQKKQKDLSVELEDEFDAINPDHLREKIRVEIERLLDIKVTFS